MRLGVLAMMGRPPASVGGLTLAYLQSATDDESRTSYTFAAQNIGAADSTRRIVVCCFARAGELTAFSSVTVAGESATKHAEAFAWQTSHGMSIFSVDVPTGTTGDVVVTGDTTPSRCGIAMYSVTGTSSTATDTATATTYPGTPSVDVTAGGVVVAGSYVYWSGGVPTCSWSGVTEDDEFSTELAGLVASVAGDEFGSGQQVDPAPTWASVTDFAAAAVAFGEV